MRADRGRRAGAAVVALLTFVAGGCTKLENAMASVPFLDFMHESPAFDPYEAARPAPANAVPVSSPNEIYEPPVEKTEAGLQAFAATLTNPLPASDTVLALGKAGFETYCTVCHGPEGLGNGPIVGPGKFPFALNLTLPQTVARSDGYIYAIMRIGRGLMPSYQRIPPHQRWAIVHYVRTLQAGGPRQPGQTPAAAAPGPAEGGTASTGQGQE